MTKPFSLQPLVNLAEHQNESATRKLGQLNKQQQSAQQKLDLLYEYRKDYQNKLQEAIRSGMSPVELRNFEQFIQKINHAIGQQLKAVEQSKASTQIGRNEFDTARRKLKSLDTLKQRHIETQKKAENKSEQKAQDEHSGRLSAYKTHNDEETEVEDRS